MIIHVEFLVPMTTYQGRSIEVLGVILPIPLSNCFSYLSVFMSFTTHYKE